MKKLFFLFLLLNFFAPSREGEVTARECVTTPVVAEMIIKAEPALNVDNELPVMPISKFILLQ